MSSDTTLAGRRGSRRRPAPIRSRVRAAADALAEVPPGRQGRRAAAPVHRPDGGHRPGLRLLGHALEPLREVDAARRRAATRRPPASSTTARCTRQVVQDEPGSCPICGMPLSKRKKGEKETLPEGVTARRRSSPRSAWRRRASRRPRSPTPRCSETLTTVGSVAFDERRLATHLLEGPGHVAGREALRQLHRRRRSKAGEPLAELYSPELYQAIQELLLRPGAPRGASAGRRPPLGRSLLGERAGDGRAWPAEKLKRWGITQAQIDEILANGQGRLHDPDPRADRRHRGQEERRRGPVRRRKATRCSRSPTCTPSGSRPRSTRTSSAWSSVGQAVEATVEAFPGETFPGKVAFIAAARSTRRPARSRSATTWTTPDHRLRPGMFATVTLKTPVAETPGLPDPARGGAAAGGPGHAREPHRGRAEDLPGDER